MKYLIKRCTTFLLLVTLGLGLGLGSKNLLAQLETESDVITGEVEITKISTASKQIVVDDVLLIYNRDTEFGYDDPDSTFEVTPDELLPGFRLRIEGILTNEGTIVLTKVSIITG